MMKRLVVAVAVLGLGVVGAPRSAAAQCEGGPTVAGHYAPDGAYISGGCLYTNPTTPGQLYPSGAEPAPSTNPAQGASRLPGQTQPSELLPVNSSDLGPAPSMVNTAPRNVGPQAAGTTAGPGVNIQPGPFGVNNVVPAGSNNVIPAGNGAGGATLPAVEPGQLPPSGAPALTGNRAEPTEDHFPGQVISPTGVSAVDSNGMPVAPAVTTAPPRSNVAPPTSIGVGGEQTRIRVRIADSDDSATSPDDEMEPATDFVP
jgi:hypothetical protein